MITGMPRIAIAVSDFSAAVATFRDKLGMPVVDLSAGSVESLGAKLAMCVPPDGSNIEIMSPADPTTALSQSVQRFIDRRGEGHFALMLEAADPDVEAKELIERGLNVLPKMEGAGGRDVHPNSTHGVLIRVYPIDSFVGHDPSYIEGRNSPGLTGIKRVVIAVKDIEKAANTYGVTLAMDVSSQFSDTERGVRSVICTPPAGGLIELIAVENPRAAFGGLVNNFLKLKGEGIFSLVLHCQNLARTASALRASGLIVNSLVGLDSVMEIDAGSMFGARFWFEGE
jgi:catechol 2,3-dioxygenase-like lactoylglutathione lyase family enzyme